MQILYFGLSSLRHGVHCYSETESVREFMQLLPHPQSPGQADLRSSAEAPIGLGQTRNLHGQLTLSTDGASPSCGSSSPLGGRRGYSLTVPIGACPPPVCVGSSAASGSRAPARSASEADMMSGGNLGAKGLKVCEDCGRRFNPASFEKHRTVCRSVFGKPNRAQFESHTQRLRSLQSSLDTSPTRASSPGWDCPPCGHRSVSPCSPPQPSLEARAEVPPSPQSTESPTSAANSSIPKSMATRKAQPRMPPRTAAASYGALPGSGQVPLPSKSWAEQFRGGEEPPLGSSSPAGAKRLLSPCRPLLPCPHCGRSFRAAAFDTHMKVCQSVFPSHDSRAEQRYVYDSRRHRMKGTAFEAYNPNSTSPSPPALGERASSVTPPQPPRTSGQLPMAAVSNAPHNVGRGSSPSPKMQFRRSVSECQLPAETAIGRSPSPNRHSGAAANEAKADRFASEASQEPEAEAASSQSDDLRAFMEDRRGRLERARFGHKMTQRPEYSALLGSSSSEQTLRLGAASGLFGARGSENCSSLLRDNLLRPSSVRRQRSHQLPMPSRIGGPERRNTQPPEVSMLHERAEIQTIGSQNRGPNLSPARDGSPGNEDKVEASWSWCSRSQPHPRAASPFQQAGLDTPKAPAERRGRSPMGGASGDDFSSYYERCLEHLDSIGSAAPSLAAPSSAPRSAAAPPPSSSTIPVGASASGLVNRASRESSSKRVKPGLAREDPTAEPFSLLTGMAPEVAPSRSRSPSPSTMQAGGPPRSTSPRQQPSAVASVTLPLRRGPHQTTSTVSRVGEAITLPTQASMRVPIRQLSMASAPTTAAAAPTGSPTHGSHTLPVASSRCVRPASGITVVTSSVGSGSMLPANAPSSNAVSTRSTARKAEPLMSGTPLVQTSTVTNPAGYLIPQSQFVPPLDMRKVNLNAKR